MFKLPVYPGHAKADEMLAVMANPTSSFSQTFHDVGDVTAVDIPPFANRRTAILQVFNSCWVSFGTAAVKNQCLFIGAGGMFGLDIADSVQVSVLADTGTARVVVLQLAAGVEE